MKKTNKKTAPTREADTKSFQEHSSMFQLGYQDSAIYQWDKLPVEHAKFVINSYRQRAARNDYLAGFAQGAEDALRGVAA